jgi:hypothetical protein
MISDAHVYIETQDGHLEDIRRIELQENNIIGATEPCRLVFKAESMKLFRSKTYKQS